STEPSSINDIKSTDWFAPAVAWAVEQGIVTGITLPDGTTSFYPEKSISRQDIAVMLNRYRDKIDKKEFPEAVKEKAFQDKDQIGGYAVDSVKALQKSGIIQGKSQTTFAPLDQAKRGEAAKMIHGMLKLN
ncbi:MAG: S-layer homology domain-containing protein, partial [Anaerovoracaceae bacterium]|nr:S-layer homology domain-containing protein [Anaerovoracaceae bacterium]